MLFNPRALGETFIVADPVAMSVAEIVAGIRRRRGQRANLFYVNPDILKLALRLAGRGQLWERVGCSLVADPAKLLSIGWKTEDQ